MVGCENKALHRWHIAPGVVPGPGIDATQLADFFQRGDWYLKNWQIEGLEILTDQRREPMPPGTSAKLTQGMNLQLGPTPGSRLAHVQLYLFR